MSLGVALAAMVGPLLALLAVFYLGIHGEREAIARWLARSGWPEPARAIRRGDHHPRRAGA